MSRKNAITIKGLKGIQKNVREIQKEVKTLGQQKSVNFEELFIPQFMRKYTEYNTFDELLAGGGFEVNSQDDFLEIPDDIFDEHISKHTKFRKWQAMLDAATSEFLARKLKL